MNNIKCLGAILNKVAAKGIVFLIWIYQSCLSGMLGPGCRFFPTCSSYTLLSIKRFGAVKGGWLSLKRIMKCHPFHSGGFDPVPGDESNP